MPAPLSIEQVTALCGLLADPTRLRLLLLLERHELTVAELVRITHLAQSRISSHLARLQRAELVQQRRSGASAFYSARAVVAASAAGVLWDQLRSRLAGSQLLVDRERADQIVRARKRTQTWAESVAGRMERQYSPGRTWEATARALTGLMQLGEVLDIACGDGVLADLVAGHARSVTGVDISATLIAAARRRLRDAPNVRFLEADMHALPLPAAAFDSAFLMHALTYTRRPQAVLAEAARVLRPGGRLVVTALRAHRHKAAMQAYDHVNLGITPAALRRQLVQAGFAVDQCAVTSREDRPPRFEVITALARKAG